MIVAQPGSEVAGTGAGVTASAPSDARLVRWLVGEGPGLRGDRCVLAPPVDGRLQDRRRVVFRNRLVGGLMVGAGIGVVTGNSVGRLGGIAAISAGSAS